MIQDLIDKIEKDNLNFIFNICENNENVRPNVAIVVTNVNDEPSQRYVKNKMAKMLEYGIKSYAYEVGNDEEICDLVKKLNDDEKITGIIIQAPFGKGITMPKQDVFDLVNPIKDIDRLHSKWIFDEDSENLPLTALGIYKLINKMDEFASIQNKNILFNGNGATTNRRLFILMFNQGKKNCRIVNSKTPEEEVKQHIEWADVIVSSTGVPEILECYDKTVISPTLIKTENGWRSDLKQECRQYNLTHPVLKAIGKLTVSALLKRAYEDAKKQQNI